MILSNADGLEPSIGWLGNVAQSVVACLMFRCGPSLNQRRAEIQIETAFLTILSLCWSETQGLPSWNLNTTLLYYFPQVVAKIRKNHECLMESGVLPCCSPLISSKHNEENWLCALNPPHRLGLALSSTSVLHKLLLIWLSQLKKEEKNSH